MDISVKYDSTTKTWSGPNIPLMSSKKQSLGQFLLNGLEKSKKKVLQIHHDTGIQLTGEEIHLQSIRVAQNLRRLGFKKGDVITVISRNVTELVVLVTGSFLIGVALNPLDPSFISRK